MRDHFLKFLDVDKALDNPNDMLAYGYDGSGIEGKARLVVFPESIEQVRQVILYSSRTNIPLVVRGLGTNPSGMVVPDNSIVLDMAHFDRIHTINLKEKWVLVDTGVVLEELQTLLRKHGYTFPIDPESRGTATIGALLATNQMDRRSHKHGRLKEHVLNIEIIDGTGKHYPDGNKDFISMEGCGAIILRAKIKIYPVIEKTTTDLLTYENIANMMAVADEKNQDLTVLSMEYINPILSRMLGWEEKHHLLIEYSGEKGEHKNAEAQARHWEKRAKAWETASTQGYPIIGDCWVPFDKVMDLVTWCDNNDLPLVGHIGLGVFHPFLKTRDMTELMEFIKKHKGDAAGQFGYGLVKKNHVPKEKKELLIKLKDMYDYNNIINRGKLYDYS